jgi:hypothetical protein
MMDSLCLLDIDVSYLCKSNEIAAGNYTSMFDEFGRETEEIAKAVGTEDPFMCLTDTTAKSKPSPEPWSPLKLIAMIGRSPGSRGRYLTYYFQGCLCCVSITSIHYRH